MNKLLTEKESKVADLFLEFLLSSEKNGVFKGVVNFFFKKHKISEHRALFVCHFLQRKKLLKVLLDSNDGLRNLTFEKSKIEDFIINNRIHDEWLLQNKLKNESKISTIKAKTFIPVLILGAFGGVYSIIKVVILVLGKE
ncbi:hypothetical protein ACFFVB_03410 [Formosa undariae]|uniref:Uncharacterized protein n=1 Tax=Formosa undariae TaxID=1325436 RepID=A0ABV5EYX9_9FLAO